MGTAASGRTGLSHLSEAEYAHFFGPEGVWRNDDLPEHHGERPTVSTIVITATDDDLATGEYFSLRMRHVRGFRGKGFMPNLAHRSSCESAGNGDVFYGTNHAAYGRAVEAGRQMCERRNAKFAAEIEEIRKRCEEHEREAAPPDGGGTERTEPA